MGSCPFVGNKDAYYHYTNIKPERWLKLKENPRDCVDNYDQDNGHIESEKWDVVEDESNRAHGLDNCWRRTHDESTNLDGNHDEGCGTTSDKKEYCICFAIFQLNQHVPSQKVHPSKIDPWLNDVVPHEKQYNTNSDQDEEALQDKLESPLVVNLSELDWLKGKRMREKSNKEDNAHLE